MDDISEVRAGHGTDVFNKVTKDKKPNELIHFDIGSGKKLDLTRHHCFSIIFKGHTRPLDLVSEDITHWKYWVCSLQVTLIV